MKSKVFGQWTSGQKPKPKKLIVFRYIYLVPWKMFGSSQKKRGSASCWSCMIIACTPGTLHARLGFRNSLTARSAWTVQTKFRTYREPAVGQLKRNTVLSRHLPLLPFRAGTVSMSWVDILSKERRKKNSLARPHCQRGNRIHPQWATLNIFHTPARCYSPCLIDEPLC